MENARIFVVRTQTMREPNGSQLYKAGFFHSNATGQFFPIKRRPAFTERLRSVSARASDCVRSGIGQAAFLFGQLRTQSNNVYHTTSRPRNVLSPGQAYHSFSHAERTKRISSFSKAAYSKVQGRRKGAQAHGFLKLNSNAPFFIYHACCTTARV